MIREIEHEGSGTRVILTECPVCGYTFERNEWRGNHFTDDHTPDDFGLGGPGRAAV